MPFVVGLVDTADAISGKDKLLQLSVDVGAGTALTIVTNAPNVQAGTRVVVATTGTELRDGTIVKTANVGGVNSEGMLCDAPMLEWVGGGAGAAAVVPESFSPGDTPPLERPRMGGAAAAAPATPAVDVKPLFEKKLSKEEKKAAAAAKKAERDAKKASKKEGAAGVGDAMASLAVADAGDEATAPADEPTT